MVLVVPRIRDISLLTSKLAAQHEEDELTRIEVNDLIYCHFDKFLLAYSWVDCMDLADI